MLFLLAILPPATCPHHHHRHHHFHHQHHHVHHYQHHPQVMAMSSTMLLFALGFLLWVVRFGLSEMCIGAIEK